MESEQKRAIHEVKNYLVTLLLQESWCKARQVGQALEILVGLKEPQTREAGRRMTATETVLRDQTAKQEHSSPFQE